jgi:hypothetical protein
MASEDISYFEGRAEAELRLAQQTDDLVAALAHRELATRYFERLRRREGEESEG